MTKVIIRTSESGEYKGFSCRGHSGFAAKGSDIVCASISILVINTINSMEQLAGEDMDTEEEEETGTIRCRFRRPLSDQGKLLMESMLLGLSKISESYGKNYLVIKFKEV